MTPALAALLVAVFINIAGFSLILPLLPFYGQEFNASPIEIALLFAAYSFGNVFGETWWGRLSDKLGRKRVLSGAMACAALTYIAFAFAPTYAAALLIRVVSGFFSGTLGVAQGYIADITPPESRAKNMGYFGAAFNLGFAVGPAIGGLLAIPDTGLAGFRPPIFAAAGLAAGAAIWSFLVLKDTRAGAMRPMPKFVEAWNFVRGEGLLLRLFIISFCGIAAFASMEAVFGLWTESSFGWTAREVGLAFIAVGAAGMVVQVFFIGPLVKQFGEARVIVGGLGLLVAAMLFMPVLRAPAAAVALMSLLMMGHSLAFPNAGALLSRGTPPDRQGSVMGLLMASNALSRIVAPPLFGLIYSLNMDAPYYMGAIMILCVMPVAWQVVNIRDRQGAAANG
ncbi:MFS transporter [Marinicaulis aureus]|uniref:MFS transporter n=1 Tax=Hyphococcus aureus TaxID=2666033 RepID=A0ABW1KW32_9PROT